MNYVILLAYQAFKAERKLQILFCSLWEKWRS